MLCSGTSSNLFLDESYIYIYMHVDPWCPIGHPLVEEIWHGPVTVVSPAGMEIQGT